METFSLLLVIGGGGIHRSPVNSPHKGQWHGALMFSLICIRINGWVNNGEAGELRRHRAHYDVTIMKMVSLGHNELDHKKVWQSITQITNFKTCVWFKALTARHVYSNNSKNLLEASLHSLWY